MIKCEYCGIEVESGILNYCNHMEACLEREVLYLYGNCKAVILKRKYKGMLTAEELDVMRIEQNKELLKQLGIC